MRDALVLDLETVPDDANPAPPDGNPDRLPAAPHHQIVVAAWAVLRDFRTLSFVFRADERAAVVELARELAGDVRLVTWNGYGFDGPVLAFRALRHGVPFPGYRRELRGRTSRHLDLCAELSDFGAGVRPRLDGAARGLGLPGKMDVDGGAVEDLIRSGEGAAVVSYCLSDVAQTVAIYLRWALFAGELARGPYVEAVGALRGAIEREPRLTRFAAAVRWERMLEAPDVPVPAAAVGPQCPECGSATQRRSGRRGPFWGCVRYPKCRGIVDARETESPRDGAIVRGQVSKERALPTWTPIPQR